MSFIAVQNALTRPSLMYTALIIGPFDPGIRLKVKKERCA